MNRQLVYFVTWALAVAVTFFAAGIATARIGDDDPVRKPIAAEIEAAVLVDASVVEMRGYGPDGKPGVWLHDCKDAEPDALGDPTLICTQREVEP